jgi:hypothetical protein
MIYRVNGELRDECLNSQVLALVARLRLRYTLVREQFLFGAKPVVKCRTSAARLEDLKRTLFDLSFEGNLLRNDRRNLFRARYDALTHVSQDRHGLTVELLIDFNGYARVKVNVCEVSWPRRLKQKVIGGDEERPDENVVTGLHIASVHENASVTE